MKIGSSVGEDHGRSPWPAGEPARAKGPDAEDAQYDNCLTIGPREAFIEKEENNDICQLYVYHVTIQFA